MVWWFLGGFGVGMLAGVVVMALCAIAGRADDEMERMRRES